MFPTTRNVSRADGSPSRGWSPLALTDERPPVSPIALDQAIAFAAFRRPAAILVCLLREQCGLLWDIWGDEPWDEQIARFSLHLDLDDLAEQTGVDLADFRRAFRQLIAARVVRTQADGTLRLNGHVAEWIYPTSGRPRLNAKILKFCLDDNTLVEVMS